MNRFFRRLPAYRIFILAGFFVLLPFQQAFADVQADARAYASNGKWREALIATNRYLGSHPDDASMLFLKGLILTQQGKRDDAIDVFTRLTRKHPTLPEAYNNLAALYAAEGQYEKARAILEAGMRTSPAYATTYENLGAVYAKLSSQAYEKALQTKAGNATETTQLAMLRSLSTDASNTKIEGTILAVAPKQEPAMTAPVAAAPAQPSSSPAQASTPSSPDKPAAKADNAEEAIDQTLRQWAAAWSDQDMKKYLSFYASNFKTPRNQSRKAWEASRRVRIVGKRRINVKVASPQITISGNTARARFKQTYSSNRFSSTTMKTINFIKEEGEWKIQRERAN